MLLRRLGLALVGLAGFSVLGQGSTTITLDASKRFQTIEGFGTAMAGADYYHTPEFVNMYAKDLGASLLRVAITPDVVPQFAPVNFGADIDADVNGVMNFNAPGAQQFAGLASLINQAKLDQMKVVGTLWTPPHWMKTNWQTAPSINIYTEMNWGNEPQKPYNWWDIVNNTYQPAWIYYGDKSDPSYANSSGGHLSMDPANLVNFGRYVTSYVVGYRQKFGVDMYALSLQNEPRFFEPYISAVYTPQEYVAAVKAIGQEFDAYNASHPNNPIRTKLMGPEDVGVEQGWITDQTKSYIDAIKADPVAARYVGGYMIHGYEGGNGPFVNPWSGKPGRDNLKDFSTAIAGDGKPLFQTEYGGATQTWNHTDKDNGSPDGAITIALRIHDGLVYGNESAWTYWQTADTFKHPDDEADGVLTFGADTTAKKYNVAKQFFRFIRPGSVRIDASPDNLSGINVSAFTNDEDGSLTMVLVNMGGSSDTTINLPAGMDISDFGVWRTSETENVQYLGPVFASNGQLTMNIPGSSIVTLVGPLSAIEGLPVPEPGGAMVIGAGVVGWLLRRGRR